MGCAWLSCFFCDSTDPARMIKASFSTKIACQILETQAQLVISWPLWECGRCFPFPLLIKPWPFLLPCIWLGAMGSNVQHQQTIVPYYPQEASQSCLIFYAGRVLNRLSFGSTRTPSLPKKLAEQRNLFLGKLGLSYVCRGWHCNVLCDRLHYLLSIRRNP